KDVLLERERGGSREIAVVATAGELEPFEPQRGAAWIGRVFGAGTVPGADVGSVEAVHHLSLARATDIEEHNRRIGDGRRLEQRRCAEPPRADVQEAGVVDHDPLPARGELSLPRGD